MVRSTSDTGSFGRNSAGQSYAYAATVWAAVDFNRGTKAMREGAYDGYDRVMFRMRWNPTVDRSSMLVWDGRTYQIESFNADKYQNTIQITAVETPGKDLTGLLPVDPEPEPEPTPTPDPDDDESTDEGPATD
jgi:head-tail adaptor